MKKISLLAAAALAATSMNVQAGGLLTNTNQNAAYVRMMSQGAIIDITGLYFNPAGTAFLSNGWHLSLNSQTAFQQRNIETTFPLFAYNQKDPSATHKFEGRAKAPVIPSFQVSYNKDKWSVNAGFALIGGGGKCEFSKGLGSFEALYAGQIYTNVATNVATQLATGAAEGYAAQAIPQYMAAGMTLEQAQAAVAGPAAEYGKKYAQENLAATMGQAYQGYSLNAYMSGRSYYFGLQLGATYKFMDNLAGFVGLRGVYGTCNYSGYVQDVKYTVMGQTADANADLTLNADQVGFGVSPIIGVDWKINEKWNVAAKYEAPTVMNLKNSTEMNDYAQAQVAGGNETLGKFADGKKIREDIPGILTLGAQYSPIEKLRLNGTFNVYFDKSAKKYGDAQKLIDSNTHEVILGAEYDVCKLITLSASWQNTKYGMSDAAMNDLSFNLSSNMGGLGLRINATERCSIDLGYMHTFYQDRTVDTETAAGVKSDNYVRKNDVFGIGVNLKF